VLWLPKFCDVVWLWEESGVNELGSCSDDVACWRGSDAITGKAAKDLRKLKEGLSDPGFREDVPIRRAERRMIDTESAYGE